MTSSDRSPAARAALRSLVWRVVLFCVAGLAVIGAFAIAWWLGAFSPTPR